MNRQEKLPAAADRTSNIVLERLTGLLESLEPDLRCSETAHLISVLESRLRNAPLGHGRRRGWQQLHIATWAEAEGTFDDRQRLGVDMGSRPVRVPKTADTTGQSLLSNGLLGVDILHIPAGSGFLPHTHSGDHLLFVLGGQGTITVDGRVRATFAGQAYLIEGAVVHAVGAVTDHIVLAVGSPHRSLDSLDRQTLTAYDAILGDTGTIVCDLCDITATDLGTLSSLGCQHVPAEHR